MKKFEPIAKNFPHMIHGGDYNPDQWPDMPEIINENIINLWWKIFIETSTRQR